jgi:hypothetical protein
VIRNVEIAQRRLFRTGRAAAATVLGLGLALLAALAFAAPASAGSVPAWIDNHTGRHLGGARFGSGSHYPQRCRVWNKDGNDDATPHYFTYACQKVDVKPHTNTGSWDDMDGVMVPSSGYYYIRWGKSGAYRKVDAGVYTRFHGLHTAKCYSGTHVHCDIV